MPLLQGILSPEFNSTLLGKLLAEEFDMTPWNQMTEDQYMKYIDSAQLIIDKLWHSGILK